MPFPEFFADVPVIEMRDPLAEFLGSAEGGMMRYRYADAVRLAGHSCGVTASAWLIAKAGLDALYGADLPERGKVEVCLRDPADQGTIGVTAQILQLVTGAAAEGGFHGIGPNKRFARRGLMRFGVPIEAMVSMKRLDTGRQVLLSADQTTVPMSDALRSLFPQAVAGTLAADDLQRFGLLWQDRVRAILLDHPETVVTLQVQP